MMAAALTGSGHGEALASTCGTSTGTGWTQVPSPSPGSSINSLSAVAAVSSCQAWTVGYYTNSNGPQRTLTEHWDGTAWKYLPSPAPGTNTTF
jgi:hypothetical protein